MAKAAAINLNEVFSPPPQTTVITPPSTYGDFLPSLSPSADIGERGSSAARRLSGQVKAMAAVKEQRASSANSYESKRQWGPITSVPMQPPAPQHLSDGPTGGQPNAKLPPLHGFAPTPGASTGPSTARTGSPSAASHLQGDRHQQYHHGSGDRQQQQQQGEVVQPLIQHPSMLPGPTPASHPYQPKRKPPSAFMRNNPMRQQLDTALAAQQQQQQQNPRSASAGSARSHATGMYDLPYTAHLDELRADYGGRLPNDAQAAAFAHEVMAAAEAAIAAGRQHGGGMWVDDGGGPPAGGGGPLGGFVAAPPWGVSSVSDLEALDSILDQLVVVDARMRKALLKGPLISFETVVPEHVMAGAGRAPAAQQQQQPRPEDDKDRTFLTSVKGVAEEGEEGGGEGGAAAAEAAAEVEASRLDVSALPPPPSPADFDSGLPSPVGMVARQPARGSTDSGEAAAEGPRDSALFPASIPNQGMHPTFTRAYLASKMAAKPQHLLPPPPATAEHLLRSRPPPFIVAPSYDQLCSQIRDVQRQYTCGTARLAGQAAAAAAAGAAAAAAGSAGGAGAAALPLAATTNQYIAGLDGPTLDEVVAHQELPISLERVRPTFVALKQKAVRSASPHRRGGSPGRGQGFAGGEG
ncbi:hypothetical protein PLESTF_000832900 [Pleodorina starrii]|nr:hypothetical protein PLESTM_000899700 [Pleodorina starrii]GLC69458.1 hypothetical protein PLESTF_000832900 [Pleodorina starrii]